MNVIGIKYNNMEYVNKNNIKSAKILPPTEEPKWQKHGWQVALNMGEYCLYIDRHITSNKI